MSGRGRKQHPGPAMRQTDLPDGRILQWEAQDLDTSDRAARSCVVIDTEVKSLN